MTLTGVFFGHLSTSLILDQRENLISDFMSRSEYILETQPFELTRSTGLIQQSSCSWVWGRIRSGDSWYTLFCFSLLRYSKKIFIRNYFDLICAPVKSVRSLSSKTSSLKISHPRNIACSTTVMESKCSCAKIPFTFRSPRSFSTTKDRTLVSLLKSKTPSSSYYWQWKGNSTLIDSERMIGEEASVSENMLSQMLHWAHTVTMAKQARVANINILSSSIQYGGLW